MLLEAAGNLSQLSSLNASYHQNLQEKGREIEIEMEGLFRQRFSISTVQPSLWDVQAGRTHSCSSLSICARTHSRCKHFAHLNQCYFWHLLKVLSFHLCSRVKEFTLLLVSDHKLALNKISNTAESMYHMFRTILCFVRDAQTIALFNTLVKIAQTGI